MGDIKCLSCGKDDIADYKELAKHIIGNKKTHKNKSSQYWAKTYLSNHKYLDRKLSMRKLERTPLTDEDRIAKEDTRRELSGATKVVPTICPRCKTGNRQTLEVEHTDNPLTWRIGIAFVKMCDSC